MISRGMFVDFSTGYNFVNPNLIAFEEMLNAEDVQRIRKYINNWNFYDGFHWQNIESTDKPEITQNWCRRFVNKFASAEFSGGVAWKFDQEIESEILPFLDDVWKDNGKDVLFQEIGQAKGVTGDVYLHVHYEPKMINGQVNPDFDDPYELYPNGRIRLFIVPPSICFPIWKDGYDMGTMESCTIMFPVRKDPNAFGLGQANRYEIMKYVYTSNYIQVFRGKDLVSSMDNPYGVIPIVHFKNLSLTGRHFGLSDLEDIIPLNVELNLKSSDISEIIDYHSAPITAIFGAKVTQLEKGANKVWGGLPKDAKIENIELSGDLLAANTYRDNIKLAMHEIGGIPQFALGGGKIPRVLSGVSLQIEFMPLLDVINAKRSNTAKSLKNVNRIILKIGQQEGLLKLSKDFKPAQIYNMDSIFGDILPKDMTQELEQLQSEFKMGLETREDALKRLKRDNIQDKLAKIDAERISNAMVFGINPVAIAAGQKLVDPETGKVIADNPAPLSAISEGQNPENKENPNKPVGTNKSGNDMKVNSGIMNFNPGKQNHKLSNSAK
jgi:hypothetical protein